MKRSANIWRDVLRLAEGSIICFVYVISVLGAIAVCIFPLWPPEIRLGVYYLSLAVAVLFCVFLSLCVIRLVLFCIIWGVTFGRHHFWFLPNLTENVEVLDLFRPLYKHDYCDGKEGPEEGESG